MINSDKSQETSINESYYEIYEKGRQSFGVFHCMEKVPIFSSTIGNPLVTEDG
jgi:hypothetical protein